MLRAISCSATMVVAGALLLACDESPSTALSAPLPLVSVQRAGIGRTLVAHFTDKTDCANVFLSTESISGVVELCQDNSPSNAQTFLTYRIVDCASECTTLEAGAGFIPNDDFQGSGTSQERLNTNTSAAANPAFARYAGNGGAITLIWQKSDASTERHSGGGTSQLVIGDLKEEHRPVAHTSCTLRQRMGPSSAPFWPRATPRSCLPIARRASPFSTRSDRTEVPVSLFGT